MFINVHFLGSMSHLSLYPRHLIKNSKPRMNDPQMDGWTDMKEGGSGDRKVFSQQKTGCHIPSGSVKTPGHPDSSKPWLSYKFAFCHLWQIIWNISCIFKSLTFTQENPNKQKQARCSKTMLQINEDIRVKKKFFAAQAKYPVSLGKILHAILWLTIPKNNFWLFSSLVVSFSINLLSVFCVSILS